MTTKLFTLAATALLLGACATTKAPSLTPLEIQSLQTRAYEAPYTLVFKSVISVFQDLGYTVTEANTDSGLINAESAANNQASFLNAMSGLNQVNQTKVTGFVETIGSKTNVRLSFVSTNETSSAYGQRSRNDTQLLDAAMYQNAFEKIDNAIFVRQAAE